MCLNDFGYELIGGRYKMTISDMIIALHGLAREISEKDFDEGLKIRFLADNLAQIGNRLHEKEMNND
jgi:hypothetical protein